MVASRANWIYLFHGEDDIASREDVQGLVARMEKESPAWQWNVATFEGEKLSLPDLVGTCRTVPFLGDKRLVVVSNLISHLGEGSRSSAREESRSERPARGGKKSTQTALMEFIPTVPPFCRLVFQEGQLVPEKDPVLRAIASIGGYVKANRLEERDLVGWIRQRARKSKCQLSAGAVDELAAAVGPNARLLNSEMIKLACYCQDRAVQAEDVRALVADARKANVFAMVDALGQRQPEAALRELRKLLSDGDHPLRVMAMVVRQFRLLIQVKELTEAGSTPDEICQKVGVPFRSVPGLQRQARNFSFQQLEEGYRRLLEYDLQVKTGLREPDAALELLLIDLIRAA